LSEGKAFESNKRVYVWGTGAFSKKVAEWFRKNGLEVSGYFDGERQDDEKLVPRMIPNAQVVIGAMCQDEIVPQVHALGYSDNEIICFY